mmetsp:Transcript_3024/g.3434  ORF Transcript_3024/g.3434 Transcript_3024/m.3434 type:complete len:334 (-) Transcript_3024:174-1175(-)
MRLSAGSLARFFALPGAFVFLSIARIVAVQVAVIISEAASRSDARICALAIPLVEPEPVIFAGHGVLIVGDLLPSKICLWPKDPQVHHDLGRFVRNGWLSSIVGSHHLSIDEPGHFVWKPFECKCVEVLACVAGEKGILGGSNFGAPPFRVVRTQNVGRHGVFMVTSHLNVNLSPVMKLGIAEDKHGRHEISVDVRVPRLHVGSLHANLVAAVAEHVAPGAELAADQGLVIHGAHLSMRAFLSGNSWIWLRSDLHLAVRETDLLLDKAHITFVETAIRPCPYRITVQVQRFIEFLDQGQGEAIIDWILLGEVGMSVDLCQSFLRDIGGAHVST